MKANKETIVKSAKAVAYTGAAGFSGAMAVKDFTKKNATTADYVKGGCEAAITAYFTYKTIKSAIDVSKDVKAAVAAKKVEAKKDVDLDAPEQASK